MTDPHLTAAIEQIHAARAAGSASRVETFFDEATFTASHVVYDAAARRAAIIDSVLDFDAPSGRTSTRNADAIVHFVRRESLTVDWHLETHAHADHLSAAQYLKGKLGGQIAIGREILAVQKIFGEIFNFGEEFKRDGSQFDRLFEDGERFSIGDIPGLVLAAPGHTPADIVYVVGDVAFIGDTLFMPDYGTARADFPGGDARKLFASIRRLLSLPGDTRLFLCHDYKGPGRDAFAYETTIADQRGKNIHVHDGIEADAFVAMRTARDKTLSLPQLLLPSVQINLRGGRLPPPESNGVSYLKLPLNAL